jgi:hypothetical protein
LHTHAVGGSSSPAAGWLHQWHDNCTYCTANGRTDHQGWTHSTTDKSAATTLGLRAGKMVILGACMPVENPLQTH